MLFELNQVDSSLWDKVFGTYKSFLYEKGE